jgi:hypothetical protein
VYLCKVFNFLFVKIGKSFVMFLVVHVLLKQRFIDYDDMFWLWWTPAGILQKIGIISKVTGMSMLIQSIVGIVITILVMSL